MFTTLAYFSRTILPSFIIPDYQQPATPLFIRTLDHWFWKCVLLWAKIVFTISIKTLNTTKDDKKCPFIIWHVLRVAGRCCCCTRQGRFIISIGGVWASGPRPSQQCYTLYLHPSTPLNWSHCSSSSAVFKITNLTLVPRTVSNCCLYLFQGL